MEGYYNACYWRTLLPRTWYHSLREMLHTLLPPIEIHEPDSDAWYKSDYYSSENLKKWFLKKTCWKFPNEVIVGFAEINAFSDNLMALWSSFRWPYFGCLSKPVVIRYKYKHDMLQRRWVRKAVYLHTVFIYWSIVVIASSDKRSSGCSPEIGASMVLFRKSTPSVSNEDL